MINEELEKLIDLKIQNDTIALSKKWHLKEFTHPLDYNFWSIKIALQVFMDTTAAFQHEIINDYVQNLQGVCEGVNDLLPHWKARIHAIGSDNLSNVMNGVHFFLSVQKMCDSINSDNIEKTEYVFVDLTLVDVELDCDTEPTSRKAYPHLHVEEIHIDNLGGPIPAANDVSWSPFIWKQEPYGVTNHIVLAAPNLQGSPTAPNNQDRHDDEERTAFITMGIGEICDFLSRLQFLFEQNGYKILTRAESRRCPSDYRSNFSAMKGFLVALRDEDEEKTCSRFELIIKDGQLRKERAPKTESEH